MHAFHLHVEERNIETKMSAKNTREREREGERGREKRRQAEWWAAVC